MILTHLSYQFPFFFGNEKKNSIMIEYEWFETIYARLEVHVSGHPDQMPQKI